ncbi:endonuclease/exonuclease/phosphatase family protein [Frigidibacter sp. MR17.24]|uniref:endonuclease/exonuclease/phosphatase family protein n=1 Tax=Frigidibacter sp. MR17.24 TaxID=3127345 RepID=UPI003012B79E
MRIATWNVEWFNALFDDAGRPLAEDPAPSARYGVSRARQVAAVGTVLQRLDPDLLMVIEAPDEGRNRHTAAMLEAIAARFGLRARSALIGFASDSQQEIAALHDPDRIALAHDPQGPVAPPVGRGDEGGSPRFDQSFRIDLDIDATLDEVRFSKPPLELAALTAGGRALRVIGVHVKSKAPHGAHDPDHARRLAIQNRRKQLAQCIWLRTRVDEHLARGDSLVVLGDFNDGAGLDEFEALFGRSGLEIVTGSGGPADRRLHDPHARASTAHATSAQPASARFWLASERQYFSAMLDYVLVSPDLCAAGPRWAIWHPFDDPHIYRDVVLREALLDASDHFPVALDIDL